MLGVALRKYRGLRSFTLIELLTVIAIIAILAALTMAAITGVRTRAARSRAGSEIEAIKMNLESYKIDNGAYPIGTTATQPAPSSLLGPPPAQGSYPLDPTISGGKYQIASEALYQALSGQIFFNGTPATGAKVYMNFKFSQVGVPSGPLSYIQDPWANAYGYSTGDASPPLSQIQYPYNGRGSYDVWSTGGTTNNTTAVPVATNVWIKNWQ